MLNINFIKSAIIEYITKSEMTYEYAILVDDAWRLSYTNDVNQVEDTIPNEWFSREYSIINFDSIPQYTSISLKNDISALDSIITTLSIDANLCQQEIDKCNKEIAKIQEDRTKNTIKRDDLLLTIDHLKKYYKDK